VGRISGFRRIDAVFGPAVLFGQGKKLFEFHSKCLLSTILQRVDRIVIAAVSARRLIIDGEPSEIFEPGKAALDHSPLR